MEDFEKLGAFYLGKRYDLASDDLTDELVLYDSKDLTTHAVIIGMTGSGKTGLGIGMIEEAALDRIPVIAIDPKGDLGNLLLTFPALRGADFEPWVDPREAAEKGQDRAAYANSQAALWKKGLAQWGQSPERTAKLRDSVDLAIYTPGSSAGAPISVLQSFSAHTEAARADPDLFRERIAATATGLLALIEVDADPVTSREHILIANLLDHAWREGRDVDIAQLIGFIQQQPLHRIGVMDIDSFYPPKERFALAMKLNNLLAAPGFEAWMQGEPLDPARLLHTPEGKPRVSVLSIAHLSDPQRMFFVSMLLNEFISWMRAQPGTGSLRAMIYMDEIFGYMPPVANPPSKTLLLTLLKQARAYGVGLVLSTQNPVDLDYKGLSNTGTWCIGRLQTERDKARVMEGLEGISAGADFDRQRMEATLAGLGKRKFLLHNVHEDQPVVFNTRWAMSYLAGPLTREQIKSLTQTQRAATTEATIAPTTTGAPTNQISNDRPPILPASVKQLYVPTRTVDVALEYHPMMLGAADVVYSNARHKVEQERRCLFTVEVADGPIALDWDNAEELDGELETLRDEPEPNAGFADWPAAAGKAANYRGWTAAFKRWLRASQVLTLLRSPTHKVSSGRPRRKARSVRGCNSSAMRNAIRRSPSCVNVMPPGLPGSKTACAARSKWSNASRSNPKRRNSTRRSLSVPRSSARCWVARRSACRPPRRSAPR